MFTFCCKGIYYLHLLLMRYCDNPIHCKAIIVLSSIQYCKYTIKYHVTEIDNWTYLSRICVKVDNKLSLKPGVFCVFLWRRVQHPLPHTYWPVAVFSVSNIVWVPYQLYKTLSKNKKLNKLKQRWLFNFTACALNNKSIRVESYSSYSSDH